MKVILLISPLLFLFACRSNQLAQPQIEPQSFLQFEYENLIDGSSGSIATYVDHRVEMFSSGIHDSEDIRQVIRPAYFFKDDPRDLVGPQMFTLTFQKRLLANLVEPIEGQFYGQLHTYINRQDYIEEFLFPGLVKGEERQAEISFQVGQIWTEASFDAESDNQLFIEEAQLFENEDGKRSIFISGRFNVTTVVAPSWDPIPLGTEIFKITNGKFGFIRIVDEE